MTGIEYAQVDLMAYVQQKFQKERIRELKKTKNTERRRSMTDEEIVKRAKEAEKRTIFGELVHSPVSNGVNSAYGIGFIEGMVEYRNSLQEEPVSEDLEEFARANANKEYPPEYEMADDNWKQRAGYVKGVKSGANWQKEQFEKNRLKHCNSITNEQAELEQGFIDQHLDKYNRTPTFLDAIEYGMKLQKEQMLKGAVTAEVRNVEDFMGTTTFRCISDKYKQGDKVKVIIIKED